MSVMVKKLKKFILISLPFLLFFLGLGITYQLWKSSIDETKRDLQYEFDIQVENINLQLSERIKVYSQILHGTRSFFSNHNVVKRNEFKSFVAELELQKFYPGIEGIGFSVIVPASEKKTHIADIQRQGFPNYKIYPNEEKREFLTSVIYLEPFAERNLQAFGYDMYSEPVLHEAMNRAVDTGEISLSGIHYRTL